MAIKANVSAFINNSTEYRHAHCAYSVISGFLELFNCCITWHSPVLCMLYMSVCVHSVCSCVSSLSLLSSYFMGLLLIDCTVLQEREIASHSWSVTLSLSILHSLSPAASHSPPSLHHFFFFCWGGWPQLARHPGRAMPEGAPCSWQIVRCSSGSRGEARGCGLCVVIMECCGFEKQHDGFSSMWIHFLFLMLLQSDLVTPEIGREKIHLFLHEMWCRKLGKVATTCCVHWLMSFLSNLFLFSPQCAVYSPLASSTWPQSIQ